MPIVITCSDCNTRLTLGDDRAGDRFECPQCDAMIKVPGSSQPPPREPEEEAAPEPRARPERAARPKKRKRTAEREFEDEPQGPDKRVVAGIVAGVAALLLVAVAGIALAVRKPAETAKKDEPPPATVAPASGKAPLLEFTPPVRVPATVAPVQPAPPATPAVPPGGQNLQATFLGSQGTGQRFCIIADNSGSMNGANIADLKTQLTKTITDLNADGEFYVTFFNSVAEPMPFPSWVKAGSSDAEKVRTWVKGINARGNTNPTTAFETAFRLNPPPDVIFFMTDGLFANTVPAKVVALNGTPQKTVVNTIMFAPRLPKLPPGAPPPGFVPPPGVMPPPGFAPPPGFVMPTAANAEALLKQIAEQNRGTFTRYTPP